VHNESFLEDRPQALREGDFARLLVLRFAGVEPDRPALEVDVPPGTLQSSTVTATFAFADGFSRG
jgi:hypothetical protein